MTINEMIKKFRIQLAVKDGVEGMAIYSKPTKAQVEELKANKPAIMETLKAEKAKIEAQKEEKEAARLLEIENIKNSVVKITAHYHDGEYLSGYTVYGEAGQLLEKLGILHYTSGWGYYIKDEVIKVLGTEFTYADAVAYMQPKIETREAKKAEEKAKEDKIFKYAKASGIKQVLKRWTEECNDPNEECDIDNVVLYAMPDGTTEIVRNHTW